MQISNDDDKVAPVLTIEKLRYFMLNIVQTLLGVCLQDDFKAIIIIGYFLPSVAIILIATQIQQELLCLVLGSILPFAIVVALKVIEAIIRKCRVSQEASAVITWINVLPIVARLIVLGGYSFMVTVHLRDLSQKQQYHYVGLSIVTLVTSMSTLHSSSVKQFGMQTQNYTDFAWASSALIRPILAICILIPQVVLVWQQPSNSVLQVLQVIYSVLWVAWMAGIVSSLKTTTQFIMESVNVIVFGEQKKHTISRTAASFLFNVLIVFAIHTNPVDDIYINFSLTNSLIVLMSFLTSNGIYNWMLNTSNQAQIKSKPNWLQIGLQIGLVIIKIVVTLLLGFLKVDRQAVIIVMAIDLAVFVLYILLNEMGRPRTRLCFLGTSSMNHHLVPIITRWLLRVTLDITVTFLCYNAYTSQIFLREYWNLLALRIITYRTYKRAILSPAELSIHLSIVLSLALSNQLSLFLIPLLMVPLPDNPSLYFISVCLIPKKNTHKNEWLYRLFYILASMIGSAISLCTAGLLETIMLFGLPVFLWSCPFYASSIYSAQGKQRSIYQNLVRNLPPVIKNLEKGTYIIRISKYLTICRVLQRGIGYRLVEFRGLESQDVTSCHNIESQTIDNMVEETWGDNKTPCDFNFIGTVLRPLSRQKHLLFEENQIKLTGILESDDFIRMFKENFMKVLLMFFKAQGISKNQMVQLRKIKSNFGFIIPEKQAMDMYPHEFAKKLGLDFELNKKVTNSKMEQPEAIIPPKPTEKLPPVKQPIKQQPKRQLFEDLEFMVDDTVPVVLQIPKEDFKRVYPQKQIEICTGGTIFSANKPVQVEEKSRNKLIDSDNEDSVQLSELSQPCYAELVISFVVYCIGRNQFLDQKKLYSLMKNKQSADKVLKNLDFDHKGELAMMCLRSSLKLSIDAFINGDTDPMELDQISAEVAKSYVGVMEEKQFEEAIAERREHIWVLNFKETLMVNRYSDREVQLYLFEIEESIVKAIWNNMRFEMYYVTNDDDERYSIQTHPQFLRNILIEASVEPLGYAPYYSGAVVI